jgi:hypothetical protein
LTLCFPANYSRNFATIEKSCADFGGVFDRQIKIAMRLLDAPLPMPERARQAVYGSEGVAAVQRIR